MTSRLNQTSEVALDDDSVMQYKDTHDILGGNRCIRNIQECVQIHATAHVREESKNVNMRHQGCHY